MSERIECSLVLLLEDDAHDFVPRLLGLHQHLERTGVRHELILAVNGPRRFARQCLEQWPTDGAQVRVWELTRKVPSGICLQTLLPDCRGEVLLVCGPYQQIDYADVDLMLAEVNGRQVDLALPWRRQRVDPPINRLQSWLFNWLVRRMTGMPFHDLSSMLRIVRRSVLEEIPLYGDLYRYLPLLAQRRGFRVREFPVSHHDERGKVGYFGAREYVSRLVDLVGMHFTFGFARKPLRYFGVRGLFVFAMGGLLMLLAAWLRLFNAVPLGDSTLLMAGLILMVAGSSIWGIGLLGEILTFVFGRQRKDYIVEKILE